MMSTNASGSFAGFCHRHTGDFETSDLVCLDARCPSSGLFCRKCQETDHEGHKVPTFPKLREDLQNLHFNRSRNQTASAARQGNKELLTSLMSTIQGAIRSLEQLKQIVQEKARENCTSFENSIQFPQPFSFQENDIGPSDSIEIIREKVKNTVQAFREEEEAHQRVKKNTERFVDYLVTFGRKSKDILSSLVNKVREQTDSLKGIFRQPWQSFLEEDDRRLRTTFSTIDKCPDIEVKEAVATRSSCYIESIVCAAGDAQLLLGRDKVYKYKAKGSALKLGIALTSALRANEYRYVYMNELGHKHYLVGSSGMSWSDSSEEDNDKGNELKFGKDDVVEMQFDTRSMMLTFQKLGDQYKVRLKVDDHLIGGDCYRFVVYLSSLEDSVELLS